MSMWKEESFYTLTVICATGSQGTGKRSNNSSRVVKSRFATNSDTAFLATNDRKTN